jgi:hypothetical protein
MNVLDCAKLLINKDVRIFTACRSRHGKLISVIDDGIIVDFTHDEDEIDMCRNEINGMQHIDGHTVISASYVESISPTGERMVITDHKNTFQKMNPTSNTILQVVKKNLLRQKIAVLCNRYQYRGILKQVTADGLILDNATCVEVSGASGNRRPQLEGPFNVVAITFAQMIELVHQLRWVFAPLPGEDASEKK